MSFLCCPVFKQLLTPDLRNRIENKINDIQMHSEWINFELFKNENDVCISKLDHDFIIQQTKIWECIAKLSIDLFRYYDHYKQFVFESRFDDHEYRNRLKNLGYVCIDGRWKSLCKPNDDVVQTNVFMYCFYQQLSAVNASNVCNSCNLFMESGAGKCNACTASMVVLKSDGVVKEERCDQFGSVKKDGGKQCGKCNWNDDDKVRKDKWKRCRFCEGPISDDKCEVCSVTINDMIQVKTPKKEPIPDNMDNNANINNEPIPGVDVIKDGNIAEIRETVAITKQNEDGTKWKCGKCEYLNEYSLGNCEVCGGVYKDGTWICGGCTMRNSCIDDACTTCDSLNDKLAVDMEDRKERCDKCGSVKNEGGKQCDKCNPINGDSEVWKDKWKCGKCGLFCGLEINICTDCGASKIGSGMWRCGACVLENKWEDQKCTVCDAPNNDLGAKYCVSCKKNRAGPGKDRCVDCDKNTTNQYAGGKWHCKYPKCDASNNNTDRYCGTCRLIRDYPRGRGDSVKVWYEDKEISIWICGKCANINKEHELVCHRCAGTRYKKRFCKLCQMYNDGTTNNCDKCYQRLL